MTGFKGSEEVVASSMVPKRPSSKALSWFEEALEVKLKLVSCLPENSSCLTYFIHFFLLFHFGKISLYFIYIVLISHTLILTHTSQGATGNPGLAVLQTWGLERYYGGLVPHVPEALG